MTSDTDTRVTSIHYTFATGSLFGPMDDPDEYDFTASADRYADLVLDALQAAYPHITVSVSQEDNVDSVSYPWTVVTAGGDYLGQSDEFVAYELSPVIENIWEDGDWYVEA